MASKPGKINCLPKMTTFVTRSSNSCQKLNHFCFESHDNQLINKTTISYIIRTIIDCVVFVLQFYIVVCLNYYWLCCVCIAVLHRCEPELLLIVLCLYCSSASLCVWTIIDCVVFVLQFYIVVCLNYYWLCCVCIAVLHHCVPELLLIVLCLYCSSTSLCAWTIIDCVVFVLQFYIVVCLKC